MLRIYQGFYVQGHLTRKPVAPVEIVTYLFLCRIESSLKSALELCNIFKIVEIAVLIRNFYLYRHLFN